MICTGCGASKPDDKFFHADLKRFLAICIECRPGPGKIATPVVQSVAPSRKRVMPERGTTYRRVAEPNIRLIPDAGIAQDIAFVIGQLEPVDAGRR